MCFYSSQQRSEQLCTHNGEFPAEKCLRTNKNNVYSHQLRAEMGTAALKPGVTTASQKYLAKLSMRTNKSTIRGLKKLCSRDAKEKRREEDELAVTSLPPKKQGRPLILGRTPDNAVQE